MITAERLQWLNDNKEHGEIKKAVKLINPKANSKGLTEASAYNIMNGHFWGKWGKVFTDTLEKIIRERMKKAEREKQKYSTTANA